MSSIFKESTIGGLSTFRKWLFRLAVGTIILGVVLGAILILTMSDIKSAEVFGKTIGTMVCVGIMLIFLSTCSKLVESRKAVPQVFAVIGGIFSILWVIFAIIGIWTPSVESLVSCSFLEEGCVFYNRTIDKLSNIAIYMALFGVLCGAILNMYEGKRKDVILPLKITAAVLLGYELLYFTIVTIIGGATNMRLAALAGFAAVIWFIVWIIAAWLSGSEKKKDLGMNSLMHDGVMSPTPTAEKKEEPKDDEALRKEIEERVRREMIEKEVRAEIEKEKAEKKED